MNLSNKAITSFQKLYQEKCGVELDLEEAGTMALEELKRFALIYRPIKSSDLDLLNKFSSEKE